MSTTGNPRQSTGRYYPPQRVVQRAVTTMQVSRVRPDGEEYSVTRPADLLECGHVVAQDESAGRNQPTRRRCKDCKPRLGAVVGSHR